MFSKIGMVVSILTLLWGLWRTWMGMEFSEIHVIVLVVAGFLFIISLFARLKASTDEE